MNAARPRPSLGTGQLRIALLVLGCLVISPAARGDDKPQVDPKADPGAFFPIIDAKDCAFDETRQRLYVTTPKQLVVVDTKRKKVIESIDLLGTLQGCDISPDFKYLAIAPISAQYTYWVKLDWTKVDDMEVEQVKFKAGASEPGVFGICVGPDNTVIFSTTYSGSGGVLLRKFDPEKKTMEEVGQIRMDSVIASSGDRNYAAVAEGNTSSGRLKVYDFKEKKLKPVADLGGFHYEIACSRGVKYFARPTKKGCDLLDEKGGKLGTLEGNPVIAAAFHPKEDRLFVMRHGELGIQEYEVEGKKVANDYPLDKPLVIKADISSSVVVDLMPVGRDAVMATYRRNVNVNFRTYTSGRLKVSQNGDNLFAVVPPGVYLFPIKPRVAADSGRTPRPKIKVIETDPPKKD